MKFILLKEHHRFFLQNGSIEFDEILSPQKLRGLNENINYFFECRKIDSSLNCFFKGRDSWREDEELLRKIKEKEWVKIAAQLTGKSSLRLGFTQIFCSFSESEQQFANHTLSEKEKLYLSFLGNNSLQSGSCIEDLACGFMICLSEGKEGGEIESQGIFPGKAGSGIFFSPEMKIDWRELYKRKGRYLLIAYAFSHGSYVHRKEDPHTHDLKHLGETFGCRLKERWNPSL